MSSLNRKEQKDMRRKKSQLESNSLELVSIQIKKKKELVVKVMTNTRNSKRIHMKI